MLGNFWTTFPIQATPRMISLGFNSNFPIKIPVIFIREQTTSGPPFFLRDSRACETRAHFKITPREERTLLLAYEQCAISPEGQSERNARARLKITTREKRRAWGDFHVRSRFARSTISKEKWGFAQLECCLQLIRRSIFRGPLPTSSTEKWYVQQFRVKDAGAPPVMHLHTKCLPEQLAFHEDEHKLHVSDSLSRLLPY